MPHSFTCILYFKNSFTVITKLLQQLLYNMIKIYLNSVLIYFPFLLQIQNVQIIVNSRMRTYMPD